MTRSLFIITAILAISAAESFCSDMNKQNQRNPFAPLKSATSVDIPEANETFRPAEGQDETLITEVFNLNFANAEQMEKTFSKLISSYGKIGFDSRQNSLIVTDTAGNLAQIRKAIIKLDTRSRQVMIEALIVNVKLTDKLKMGVDWTKLGSAETYFSQGLSVTNSINPYGKITFSATNGNWNIQGLIDFVESNKDVRILANPKILVLNNQRAIIKTVKEIPYQELSQTSGGGNIGTTAFKEAGVVLEVTPQIAEDGYIIMSIKPEQSAHIDTMVVQNSQIPVIETRKADTILRVKNGQTIIIGGLRERQPTIQENKVPLLGDVPLAGAMFRKVDNELIESELGIFITPRIYTEGELTAEEKNLIKKGEENTSLYEAGDLLRLNKKNKKTN